MTGAAEVTRKKIFITSEEREEREYTVPASARLKVEDGQPVHAGDLLTEGSKDPDEVLRQAVTAGPANRAQARQDPDFDTLREDEEFLSIVYPQAS